MNNNLEFKNMIANIFLDAYSVKEITISENIKNYGFEYETLNFIEDKIKEGLNENNLEKVFDNFIILVNFFKDLNFAEKYFYKLSTFNIKTYASHNFELIDIQQLFKIMDDFNHFNFKNMKLSQIKNITNNYFRLIFNKNNLNISIKEKKIMESLYE